MSHVSASTWPLDIAPLPSRANVMNRCPVHSVPFSKRHDWFRRCANRFNILWTKAGSPVALSCRVAMLRHHVVSVLLLCAQKQMSRVYTRWDIACVTHPQTLRNWPVMEFPRDTVSAKSLSVASSRSDSSVSTTKASTCPQPAPLRLFYLGPETISNRRTTLFRDPTTSIRAKLSFQCPVGFDVKYRPADLTGFRGFDSTSIRSRLCLVLAGARAISCALQFVWSYPERGITLLTYNKIEGRLIVHLEGLLSGILRCHAPGSLRCAGAFRCLNYTRLGGYGESF